jgi:hypothetical protein
MGGEDEARARHRGHGEPGRRRRCYGSGRGRTCAPDGHTFLFGNTSTQVLVPAIMAQPPYDPLKPIVDSGPEATRQFIAAELARWTPIIKATGFKME